MPHRQNNLKIRQLLIRSSLPTQWQKAGEKTSKTGLPKHWERTALAVPKVRVFENQTSWLEDPKEMEDAACECWNPTDRALPQEMQLLGIDTLERSLVWKESLLKPSEIGMVKWIWRKSEKEQRELVLLFI
jgi:hypothetical protein